MSTKLDLEIQRTFKYNSSYAHLNDWETIGTKRPIGQVKVKEDNESQTATLLYLVSSQAPADDIKQALMDGEQRACSCEHDCCGHFFSNSRNARKIPNTNVWAVKVYSQRNI